jgi:hypothetical protein
LVAVLHEAITRTLARLKVRAEPLHVWLAGLAR